MRLHARIAKNTEGCYEGRLIESNPEPKEAAFQGLPLYTASDTHGSVLAKAVDPPSPCSSKKVRTGDAIGSLPSLQVEQLQKQLARLVVESSSNHVP